MTDGTPFSSQMSQESCKAKPRVLSSPRLLEEDSPEFPSQQLQATSSGGSESLSNLDLSHGPLVALEYLPFFRTYGQLLAEEELAPQPEAFRDQGGDQSVREEDSELPSGFFPYYRSKEESFPSLALPGRSCAGSRGPSTRREVQACRCCTRTISGDGSVSQGDAEGVWGSTGCPGPRETEGVQGSTGHPGPFKSGRHRGFGGSTGRPGALQTSPRALTPAGLARPPMASWSSVSLVKSTEAGGRLPHLILARPLTRKVAWEMCFKLHDSQFPYKDR